MATTLETLYPEAYALADRRLTVALGHQYHLHPDLAPHGPRYRIDPSYVFAPADRTVFINK